ncbi:hypothetical protein CSB67_1889 [Enterobacter hormaechei]|nr:hypothetical protein CSB67_1889 [Enterobacter hormaechei]
MKINFKADDKFCHFHWSTNLGCYNNLIQIQASANIPRS